MNSKIANKKKLIRNALAETIKEHRGEQSMFKFCSENDISLSVLSEAERGKKDPQLTTVFKIAEAFSMKAGDFVNEIVAKLPKDFYMIEK